MRRSKESRSEAGKQERDMSGTFGGAKAKQRCRARSWHAPGDAGGEGSAGSRELLRDQSVLQIMQEGERRHARTATVKTVVLISRSVSKAAELRTAVKGARCPRAKRRARRKCCSREQKGPAERAAVAAERLRRSILAQEVQGPVQCPGPRPSSGARFARAGHAQNPLTDRTVQAAATGNVCLLLEEPGMGLCSGRGGGGFGCGAGTGAGRELAAAALDAATVEVEGASSGAAAAEGKVPADVLRR
eukprot:4801434-Pleurochrysis_carterae.AAC.1